MELNQLEAEIREAIEAAIKESVKEDEDWATTTLDVNDGYLELSVWQDGSTECLVNHDGETNRCTSSNLENWAAEILKEYAGKEAWAYYRQEICDEYLSMASDPRNNPHMLGYRFRPHISKE